GGEDSEEPDDDNEDPVGDTDADDSAGDTDGNEGPSTSDDLDDIPNTGANIGTLALLATLISAAGAALLIRNRATRKNPTKTVHLHTAGATFLFEQPNHFANSVYF